MIQQNLTIDDIVLVMDESLLRGCWQLGRVVEVINGRGNLVRSEKVKTSKSEILRPIDRLCFLEQAKDENNE